MRSVTSAPPPPAGVEPDDEGALRRFRAEDFSLDELLARKREAGLTASLALPARDEEATIAGVLAAYLPLRDAGLLDEVVVIDSLSTDRTAEVAAAAGATVVHVREPHPDLPAERGKGEAMWRALWATTGDLVAFADADVLDAGPHYVLGLLGPMLRHPEVQLVKGFYRRPVIDDEGNVEEHGGRVTELTARPLLSLCEPALAQLVQPLAGEWAGRRDHLESLSFPVGYGVEIAVVLDTFAACGLRGLAQTDLGVRTHSRQSQQALGVMAAEVLGAALRRLGIEPVGTEMAQFAIDDHGRIETPLRLTERPPVRSLRNA